MQTWGFGIHRFANMRVGIPPGRAKVGQESDRFSDSRRSAIPPLSRGNSAGLPIDGWGIHRFRAGIRPLWHVDNKPPGATSTQEARGLYTQSHRMMPPAIVPWQGSATRSCSRRHAGRAPRNSPPALLIRWQSPRKPDLDSFAAITDEPPAEVAATGDNRCVIPSIRNPTSGPGSPPEGRNLEELYGFLNDRERPYYRNELAA